MEKRKALHCIPLLILPFLLSCSGNRNLAALPGWHELKDLYEIGAITDVELAQIAYISSGRQLYDSKGNPMTAYFGDPAPLSEAKETEILASYKRKEASENPDGAHDDYKIYEYYGYYGGYYCVRIKTGFFSALSYEVIGNYLITYPVTGECVIECWSHDAN